MDTKLYYQRIREIEEQIPEEDTVIVSLATSDGGRAGVRHEVSRYRAAKLVADGAARLATREEAQEWRAEQRLLAEEEKRRRAAAEVHVSVVSGEQAELIAQHGAKKSSKG